MPIERADGVRDDGLDVAGEHKHPKRIDVFAFDDADRQALIGESVEEGDGHPRSMSNSGHMDGRWARIAEIFSRSPQDLWAAHLETRGGHSLAGIFLLKRPVCGEDNHIVFLAYRPIGRKRWKSLR